MLDIVKLLFNIDKKQYTKCLVCGKKLKMTKENENLPICANEQCNNENYTSIDDVFN